MSAFRHGLWIAALLSVLRTSELSAQSPRYAEALAQELSSMGFDPRCNAEAPEAQRCTFSGRTPGTHGRVLHAVYDDSSDSVYIYVERYLQLAPEAARTQTVLRRLMELNWELLVGKFEWNPRSGEVRLGAVLNTDSNFDRRALRSIVRALETVVERFSLELTSLASR